MFNNLTMGLLGLFTRVNHPTINKVSLNMFMLLIFSCFVQLYSCSLYRLSVLWRKPDSQTAGQPKQITMYILHWEVNFLLITNEVHREKFGHQETNFRHIQSFSPPLCSLIQRKQILHFFFLRSPQTAKQF